jgi:hypothetical protein
MVRHAVLHAVLQLLAALLRVRSLVMNQVLDANVRYDTWKNTLKKSASLLIQIDHTPRRLNGYPAPATGMIKH